MKKHIFLVLILVLLMAAGCSLLGPGSMEGTVPTTSAPSTSVPATSIPATSIPLTSSSASPTGATEATIPTTIPSTGATTPSETTTPAETEPAVHSHSFSDWSQTEAPSCEATGMAQRHCPCGQTETKILAARGHSWDKGTVTVVPASCADQGLKLYHCGACGSTYEEKITGEHSFGDWAYEEYTYIIPANPPHNREDSIKTSHRQVRSCTNCGHRETDGTPEHSCQIGSGVHKVTTLDPGDCLHKALRRSTCTVCGWYTDYEGSYGDHVWGEEEHIHVSDYGPYTNELDLERTPCILCDYQIYQFIKGQGYQDVQTQAAQYRFYITNKHYAAYQQMGSAYSTGIAQLYQYDVDDEKTKTAANHLLLHPDWQTVYRNPVYDSDGSLLQYDVSWYDVQLEERCTVTLVIADIPNMFSDSLNEYYNSGKHTEYVLFFAPGYLRPALVTKPLWDSIEGPAEGA